MRRRFYLGGWDLAALVAEGLCLVTCLTLIVFRGVHASLLIVAAGSAALIVANLARGPQPPPRQPEPVPVPEGEMSPEPCGAD